jgi:hypothetical protein
MGTKAKRAVRVEAVLERLHRSGAYQGRHVVIVAGKAYATSRRKTLARLLDDVAQKHPGDEPVLAYIPNAAPLILVAR